MSLLCKLILNEHLVHAKNCGSSSNNINVKCLYGTGSSLLVPWELGLFFVRCNRCASRPFWDRTLLNLQMMATWVGMKHSKIDQGGCCRKGFMQTPLLSESRSLGAPGGPWLRAAIGGGSVGAILILGVIFKASEWATEENWSQLHYAFYPNSLSSLVTVSTGPRGGRASRARSLQDG